MATLKKAITIATAAHKSAKDKYGSPYIQHVTRVMEMGKTTDEKILGALHDVVEDSNWTFKQLEKEGFSKKIIAALKCVTKTSDTEDYEAFINRIAKNKLAIKVKLNDLSDNMDIRRMDKVRSKDIKRLNKYLKAYKKLSTLI
jgi:(p)ppGpp synthase/HD superfamily hydrolase